MIRRVLAACLLWCAATVVAHAEPGIDVPAATAAIAGSELSAEARLSVEQQYAIRRLSEKVASLNGNEQAADAFAPQQEKVAILEAALGDSHWQTISERAFLAELARVQAQSAEGRREYSAARDSLARGIQCIVRDDHQQAEELLTDAATKLEAIVGEDSVSIATASEWLGAANMYLGSPCQAKNCLLRTAKVRKTIYGANHPEYSNALGLAGSACIETKDYDQAEELLRQALAIDRRSLGADSTQYAIRLSSLAIVLIEQGKLPEAEAMNEQALRIIENNIGRESYPAANCFANAAEISIRHGESKLAHWYLQRSLSIYEKLCPTDSLILATMIERHAKSLRKLNDVEGATAIEARVATIRARLK